MVTALAVALILHVPGEPPEARCSLTAAPVPARTGTYAILRATLDSASDGVYHSSPGAGVSRRPPTPVERPREVIGPFLARAPGPPPQRPHEVFGQIMEVIAAEGADATRLPPRRRVLVVWWGLGAACDRALPSQALVAAPGELFLQLSLRDSAESKDGTPTYDIGPGAFTYAPGGRIVPAGGDLTGAMTISEFVDLYRALPEREARARDPVSALRPLIDWADANRRLAAKFPARNYVCSARREVTQRPIPECDALSSRR